MRRTNIPLLTAALPAALWLLPALVWAHWPTTVQENIAIAADPDTTESYPKALALPGNRTLITYRKGLNQEMRYQILDRFGNMMYSDGQPLVLNQPWYATQVTHRLISDGAGGAVAAWAPFSPVEGIYAQRLDSLGNRLWGDDGVRIFFQDEVDFDLCWDGQDGFWLAVTPTGPYVFHLYLQHIDGQGNLLLGDSGQVVEYVPQGIVDPIVVPDDEGGCIVVDWDGRLGYVDAVFAQRYDVTGHPMWGEDLYICQNIFWKSAISDGEGGMIVQANPGGANYNRHWRVNGAGQILWTRDHLTWHQGADMALGEPNHFYLEFYHNTVFYGQRMTLMGENLWPTWGSGQYGAPLSTRPPPPWLAAWDAKIHFQSPFLFAIYAYEQTHADYERFFAQKLDTASAMQWGATGTLLATSSDHFQKYVPVPAGEGGYVALWEQYGYSGYDIYAKRVYADGALGGPFPLDVSLTPHDSPIQIPVTGGTFTFDVAIADTDSVGGIFDAWIEVMLPNGSTLEILARNDLAIQPNGTLVKNNLQQFVPAAAPAGLYTYTAYAGNYPYQSPWGQDSFTFEKMGGGGISEGVLADTPALQLVARNSAWTLEGWDEPIPPSPPPPRAVD